MEEQLCLENVKNLKREMTIKLKLALDRTEYIDAFTKIEFKPNEIKILDKDKICNRAPL